MKSNTLLIASGAAFGFGTLALILYGVAVASASSSVLPALSSCTTWKFPTFNELPKDVVARSIELQHDLSKPIGYQTIEVWHDVTYRFNVRIHPANQIVSVPHRGADVEVCTSVG